MTHDMTKRRSRAKTLVLVPVMLSLLGACATTKEMLPSGADLRPAIIGGKDDLRRGAAPPSSPDAVRIGLYNPDAESETGVTEIRRGALQEGAQSYGSQMGYARRAWEIMGRLETHSGSLSTTFDFNRVVSFAPQRTGVVIPPVVSRSFDAFIVNAAGTEASAADEYLTILRPGKLAPIAPTWRDYLIFSAEEPEDPAKSLLPTIAAERDMFEAWFREGWKAGADLADAEFSDRVTRLQQDYTGMLQYRRLVAQGMMDKMVLADADFGVTAENGEMRIGSRTVRVTSEADFQADPSRWRIATVSARDALIVSAGEIPDLSGVTN
jgi:defect-in-organelle-trafficking protein DotC